jgi:hypothetical protein
MIVLYHHGACLRKGYMKKAYIFLIPFFTLCCASQPYIRQYTLDNGTRMYFIPASTWTGNNITIDADFNFKNDVDIKITCNMSLTGRTALPKGISSISVTADSDEYPLSDIQILSLDNKTNTVRLTSLLKHADFLRIIKANDITIRLTMNGLNYECVPSREFSILKNEFKNNYFVLEGILQ